MKQANSMVGHATRVAEVFRVGVCFNAPVDRQHWMYGTEKASLEEAVAEIEDLQEMKILTHALSVKVMRRISGLNSACWEQISVFEWTQKLSRSIPDDREQIQLVAQK